MKLLIEYVAPWRYPDNDLGIAYFNVRHDRAHRCSIDRLYQSYFALRNFVEGSSAVVLLDAQPEKRIFL